MTTTTRPADGTARRTARDPGRLAGIAFAVSMLAATTLWGLEMKIYDSDLDRLAAHGSQSAPRVITLVLSHLVMPLAAFFLLSTVARLRRSLDDGGGGTSVAGQLAFGAATVTAVGFCLMTAAQHVSVLVSGGGYVDGFPADPAVGYGLALLSGNLGNATVWGAAVMVVVLGREARRQGLLPRWLAVLGYVTAPLLVAGWYYGLPVLLLGVWVALAGLTVQTGRA